MTYLTPDEMLERVRSGLGRTNVRFRSATIGPAALVRTVLCATPIKYADSADGYSEQHHQACEGNSDADAPRYLSHHEGG